VQTDPGPGDLDDRTRFLIFRTVRELLINIVKHSETQNAEVAVVKDGDNLLVVVEDHGVGFDPALFENKNQKYGLFSIRERLEGLQGRFEIESEPGKGCRVTISAPLAREG